MLLIRIVIQNKYNQRASLLNFAQSFFWTVSAAALNVRAAQDLSASVSAPVSIQYVNKKLIDNANHFWMGLIFFYFDCGFYLLLKSPIYLLNVFSVL